MNWEACGRKRSRHFAGGTEEKTEKYMNVCCNRCHGNAVKGFWVLRDNIYECMLL
jgi:hypothetical protein